MTRLAFGVWRLAFGVWRLAFGVWRLAFGVLVVFCQQMAVQGISTNGTYGTNGTYVCFWVLCSAQSATALSTANGKPELTTA